MGDCSSTVVKALHYKSEGRWFDPNWYQWIFHWHKILQILRSHYGPGVNSASKRNEYQEYFLGSKGGRCIRLTTLPPSCAVVMKSGNLNFLEPSGSVQACNGTALPLSFLLYLHCYLIVASCGIHWMQHSDCMISEQDICTHLHPSLKLIMAGAITSLPSYAFMVCTGIVLPVPLWGEVDC